MAGVISMAASIVAGHHHHHKKEKTYSEPDAFENEDIESFQRGRGGYEGEYLSNPEKVTKIV